MSRYMVISCTMCGRDLYRPLTTKELREGKYAHFPGFYLSQNKSGKEEEYCEKCYEAMLKEENQSDEAKHESKTGYWIRGTNVYHASYYKCSECGRWHPVHNHCLGFDYCNGCGAKMVEPQERGKRDETDN